MTLSEDRLRERLAPRAVRFYPQVESTNDLAMEWLQQGAVSGAVVVADEQSKGRGRLGRTWHTPPGVSLAVSMILRPRPEHLPQVTMLGALAIHDMLVGLGLAKTGIKWPNDVHINRRKVSGVLAEAAWTGDKLAGVVLGMGINVRADFSGSNLAQQAISIEPALGRAVDRVDLLVDLLARADVWAEQLGTKTLFTAWQSRLVTLGQTVTYGGLTGTAELVTPDGALSIRTGDGQLYRVFAGDVVVEDGS
ncbi:MAG: biotin--[acetyl-CoA-carboxylase] ligase [Anaerolineaceae bacterium]|nr:biotin--[acetyl-CoA-carboxylase] ligase [Anaerolineaceae bacterium]